MEGNDGGLTSYYQHHHHHHQSSTSNSATNGSIFSHPNSHYSASEPTPLVFPHSVTPRASAAPSPALTDSVKRKRGRPRKYGPGGPATEMSSPASTAMKKAPATTTAAPSSLPISSSSAISPSTPTPHKKEPSSSLSSSSNKKAQLDALGSAGHGFTPHVITVAAGEDVAQKIMSFMQQRKRAVCILSASGSISNASLRQPAMLGGNVSYEGRFEILSLSGSYLHTEIGGASSRTGGLSVCLSGADGRIVGGGVGGPLKAAGPVQVIASSFVIDGNKDSSPVIRAEAPVPVLGATVSPISFRPFSDSSGRSSIRVNDEHRNIGGSGFMFQSRAMHPMHRSNIDIELTGRRDGGGACQSPEEGDDDDIRD
ncbi:AT-hook motif nuclear-localized protein 14-like [Magnolia sinica]|uniref:AT-hook motif nuclear-localized protein 14-like n=1 Tax=Magnolia sinica TaxID=86752 RepID=UPI00265ABA57|nr:AT-hook motif nuclear-localized protein 14-like [Magnolia sinica]